MRQMFRLERSHQTPVQAASLRYEQIPARRVHFRFALAAAAIIVAGIWLSFIGDEIGKATGWNASFVGSLFLAISTSAPELVVTITALRLGAIDMAVADVLGANMLAIAIIAPVDLAYAGGFVLSSVSSTHLITAAVAVMWQ